MVDVNIDDIVFLQCGEDVVEDALFGPAVRAGVDSMPITKFIGEPPPFTALFGNIQNGIEHLEVGYGDITALFRQ